MQETDTNGKIFLTTFHHSDLTWQFPYEEYDAIREEQLNLILGFFEKYPEYSFILDQAYAVENYLQRNPDKKEIIRKLVDKGNGPLELAGSYSIPDLNLCSGESFLRNCILGQQYYAAEFGFIPKTASLMDAFGMPMQVPQVLSLLGYQYLIPGRAPNARHGLKPDHSFVWNGAGGSSIAAVSSQGGVDKSSYLTNVPVVLNETERFLKTLTDLQNTTGNVLAYYMTEIQMLDEAFFQHIDTVNSRPGAARKITFGRFIDYCKTLNLAELPTYTGEFNPVFTGCYTSRIGIKQQVRAAESALFAAELLSVLAAKPISLTDEWKQLALGEFHDALCGCHHDNCNIDVFEKLDFVLENTQAALEELASTAQPGKFTVLNPSRNHEAQLVETSSDMIPEGFVCQKDGDRYWFESALPSFGAASFNVTSTPPAAPSAQTNPAAYQGSTDYFNFDFTTPHPKIQSKRFKHNVFGQQGFGEVLFRHESGSMWAETLLEPPMGAEWQEEAVCSVEEDPLFIKITTQGKNKPYKKPISGNLGNYWMGFESLTFQKEYIFPLHQPYFKLRLTLDFKGFNTKVSLRIPVEVNPLEATALYDTPFAAIPRKPYFEVPYQYEASMQPLASPSDYTHAKGDYPALHWVDYCDNQAGLAVSNSGTPGHQLVGKDIFISLLRSGTRCLDGTMYPQPGTYDNGIHEYEFAFSDHLPSDTTTPCMVGDSINHPPLVLNGSFDNHFDQKDIIRFSSDNLRVSTIHQQEDVIVLRLYESFGTPTCTELECGSGYTCHLASIQGEVLEPLGKTSVSFEPYEIKTFALVRSS